MNKLLKYQVQKYFGKTDRPPGHFAELLNEISNSYDDFEKKREAAECNIGQLSKEISELNSRFKKNGPDELAKAHNQQKIFLETIEVILFSVDMLSLRILQMSAVCEKVYGYTSAEFLTDSDLWQKVILPEDIDIVYRQIKALYEGKPVISRYRIVHKDKSIRWLESKIIPGLDDEGQLMRLDGVTHDISESKRAEKELEESVSLLEATLESTADGILVADNNGKITRFNNKFIEQSGIPREILDLHDDEKAIGCMLDQLKNPEEFLSKIKELYGEKNAVSFDTVHFKDGRIFERYSQPQLINGKYVGRVWSFRDITERKIAEDKIRESELRYRSLFEQATDAICISDSSMKFVDMNSSGCNMLGYSKEEFLQLSVADFFPAADLLANPFKLDELKSGKAIRNERRFIKKDGTLIDVEVNVKIMEDGRLIVFGRDITERKEAEKLLIESEFRYRSLFEEANDAICIADPSMRLYDINPSGRRLLGYSKEEFLTLSVMDLFLAEDIKANPFVINKLEPGGTVRNERRFKRKDGTLVDVEVNGKVLQDGRFIVFGRDITERKQAEKLVKESELRYRSLIEQATDAICIADASLKFIDMNPYACQVLGYSKEEALQLFVTDVIFIEDLQTNPFKFNDVKSGVIIRNERNFKRKDGTPVIMEVSTKMMEDGRFIMFGHDISERKKAEETIRRSEASLEIKNKQLEQKNKELEQFAYVASHDMQEPLRTTSSFVELLQQQYQGKLDDKADKYLTYIHQASDRMKVLIKDLLDYSRIGRQKELRQVDCAVMLDEVLADLGKAIEESGAEIIADKLPVINGYPTEIKQLFQNLIINAIKFREKNTVPVINISVQEKNNYWEFAFSDNGIGMEEQHRERIFIIFQRLHTRNEYEGSGIGLAHCKKIVELHGGKIWVDSVPGKGSSFHFTIHKNNN